MLDLQGRYTLQDYARTEPFCSFLPGIAGEKGIPMWCYYVNRGQAVCSFGVEDKEHAIMEFFPAHQAYQYTGNIGFRTFLRVNGQPLEPFRDAAHPHAMHVGMNDLCIEDHRDGVKTQVVYFTLPEERAAALVRRVTLTNESTSSLEIDMLDGMPALLPYGLNLHSVKNMTQTAKAWLQAEETNGSIAFFRTRASMEDTSEISQVEGVNFAFARSEAGDVLPVFVDPRHVFSYDTGLSSPLGFLSSPYEEWRVQAEVTQNIIPCCFFGQKFTLAPGESRSHTVVIGQTENKDYARALCARLEKAEVLSLKQARAGELAWQLTNPIASKTADPVFDMYCRQTYLDNLLRGGTPVSLPGGKVTYLYSRKHGDPERDYNAFRMRPEYYSQGNGNFRDVNQNRRCDVLFFPEVEKTNIHTFFNLMQADGYNPLVVEYMQYTLPMGMQQELCALVHKDHREEAARLLAGAFTPGALLMALENWKLSISQDEFFSRAISHAQEGVAATFGEGFWTDHWTYNLDQIESYLSVYPEKEAELLFGDGSYTWFVSPESVLPRAKRYCVTPRGVRQYRFLEKQEISSPLKDIHGKIIHATLIEKLVTLATLKSVTLDPWGMGVEMEAGKPGWYDALNGLPGLLGSSMPETLELARLLRYVINELEKHGRDVELLSEAAHLFRSAATVLETGETLWKEDELILPVWNALNNVKEQYRQQLRKGLSGEKTLIPNQELCTLLKLFAAYVDKGIEKAMNQGNGLCPTYFAYDVTDYVEDENGLHPTDFSLRLMPDFLEGQVRYLRLNHPMEEKCRLTQAVRASRLYDRKLNMYKVNAALNEASYEIGRAHAFTPGWLENESIWLHMEYKYLLELLRSGMYEEFAEAFHNAAVPFLDPAVYGRSTLENSSFIASSANPDPCIHGKGFVARLSGSTAELLSIWQIMLLGQCLFTHGEAGLQLNLSPVLPRYLTKGMSQIEATLLGSTKVIYYIEEGREYFPGNYTISHVEVLWLDGSKETFPGMPAGDAALCIRQKEAAEIRVRIG